MDFVFMTKIDKIGCVVVENTENCIVWSAEARHTIVKKMKEGSAKWKNVLNIW